MHIDDILIVTFERGLSWPPLIIEDAEHLESALLDFNDSTLLGVPFDEKPYATFEFDHCGDVYEGYIERPVDCRPLTDAVVTISGVEVDLVADNLDVSDFLNSKE